MPASLPLSTIRYSLRIGLLGEIAFEDLARAGGVARLRRQRGAGDVRRHAVMRHGAPGMVLRRRLREPDVAGIARELAALQRADDGVAVADLAARGVHEIGAALHHADQLVVEQVLGLGMQRRVDGDHVADLDQRLDVRVEGEAELLLDLLRQAVLVGVVQLARRRASAAAARRGRCGRRRRCRHSCLRGRRSARRNRRCSSRP